MNRRTFVLASLAWPLATRADAQPWQARLLHGGFDGTSWRVGLHIQLMPGWKTYWRVPGAGGIAPEVSVTGTNLKSFQLHYPMPERLKAGEDEVIGYRDEVVFPILLTPEAAAKPLQLQFNSFLGVCDLVCIPVRYETVTSLTPVGTPSPDTVVMADWLSKVPKLSTGVVEAATAVAADDGTVAINISLSRQVLDIFAEGKPIHYFHPPKFDGLSARLKVSGVKTLDELKGTSLRLTLATAQGGLEEIVTVV